MGRSLGLQNRGNGCENALVTLCHLLAGGRRSCGHSVEDSEGVFASSVTYAELAETATGAVTALDDIYGVQLFDLAGQTRPKAMYFSGGHELYSADWCDFPLYFGAEHQCAPTGLWDLLHHVPQSFPTSAALCGRMRQILSLIWPAIIAIIQSLRYSGAMMGLIHATNRLYRYDPNAWQEIYTLLPEGVLRDRRPTAVTGKKYETPVGETADRWNDAYLKANDQTDGVQSYGRMVDPLIAF